MNCDKISVMKNPSVSTEHRSYKIHRKQFMTQILLPFSAAFVLLGFLAYIIVNLTFANNGADLQRWAAISTMWIALPAMVIGIFLLLLISCMIYILTLLLRTAPVYTKRIQEITYKGRSYAIRGANLVVKPVIYIEGLLAHIQAFFGRK